MAVTSSPRLGLTRWGTSSDPFTRAQLDGAMAALDTYAARTEQGAGLNARPAAGVRDRYWTDTTTNVTYRDTGTTWVALGANQAGLTVHAAQAGQSGDLYRWLAAPGGATVASMSVGGNLSVAGVAATGNITANGTVSTGGAVSAGGQVAAASAAITGAVTAGSVAATGQVSAGSLSSTGAATVGSVASTGAVVSGGVDLLANYLTRAQILGTYSSGTDQTVIGPGWSEFFNVPITIPAGVPSTRRLIAIWYCTAAVDAVGEGQVGIFIDSATSWINSGGTPRLPFPVANNSYMNTLIQATTVPSAGAHTIRFKGQTSNSGHSLLIYYNMAVVALL